MRSGDPANVTWTPRALSASATASDGSTWPPVPPAAIRHASFFSVIAASDVKEDSDRDEDDHHARAAVGDERDPDAGVGKDHVGGDQRRDPDEAELLADHRSDHVGVRLGEVEDLRDARA